jgi:glycosyltransferase involved in cell wall biosynthesis
MADNSPCVKFLPLATKKELVKYLSVAKGYLFPSLEPFGIAPVEALAAGCPVIAFSEGGSRDFIEDGKNGTFFDKQTVKSLEKGILKFEEMKFDRLKVSRTAERFSLDRFNNEIIKVVKNEEK